MQTLVDKVERAEERRRKLRRMLRVAVPIVLIALLIVGGFYYYFPFATGMKSGRLNYVVYKGIVFKTYEGRLIQAGIRPADTGGFQSNEFVFSVSDKEVAEQLMNAGGQTVELHYTEYLGALPWRGYSRYVVDRIVNITDNGGDGVAAPTEGTP
ncbi:MAG: hypothetical protein D8B51_08140, partial [Tannerella sp.]